MDVVVWQCYLSPGHLPGGPQWADYLPELGVRIEAWWSNVLQGGPRYLVFPGPYCIVFDRGIVYQLSQSGKTRPVRRVLVTVPMQLPALPAPRPRL